MGVIMATYLDNAGVTQILTKIKSLLAKKAEITAIPTKVSQLTNDSQYQNATEVNTKIGTELGKLDYDFKDEQEGNSFAANWFLSGITQTDGKIKAEKADFDKAWGNAFQTSVSRGGEAITETQVDSKIRAAVDKITSFEYKVVSELPPESDGVKGTIYLLRHGGNDNTNSFDEYILVDTYSSGGITYSAHYEKIGTTDIDLTPYAKKTEIPTKVSQLSNDSDFATRASVTQNITGKINALDYSDTAEDGKYVSSVSETNGVIKVTRASLPAVGTADSPISNATIESIFTQVFG
jgi:hypothetical protein